MPKEKKVLIALCILGSTMYLAGGVTTPSLAYIIDSYPSVNPNTVTTLITIPGLVALFTSFFVGPLVLKYNSKYLLMASVSITLIYFGVFVIVGGRGPFFALMLAAGLLGIHRGAGSALVNSIIGDFMEPAKRAASIALCGAMMQGGSGLVAIVGGMISAGNDGADWPIAHYLGFLSILTLIIFALIMPKKNDEPTLQNVDLGKLYSKTKSKQAQPEREEVSVMKTIKDGISNVPKKVYIMMALHFVFVICMIAFSLYTSVYIITEHQLGTSVEAGLVSSTLTFFSVLIGLTYTFWGRLLGKWIVPTGYLLSALGYVAKLVFTSNIAGIVIAAVILGIGWNLANPYVSSRIMALSPRKLIPILISVHLGIQNLGMFLAPYALRQAAWLFGGGVSGALTVSIVVLPICAIAAAFLFARDKRVEI